MPVADGVPPYVDSLTSTLALSPTPTPTSIMFQTLGVEGATTINAWGPAGEALVEVADPIVLSMGTNVSRNIHRMFRLYSGKSEDVQQYVRHRSATSNPIV